MVRRIAFIAVVFAVFVSAGSAQESQPAPAGARQEFIDRLVKEAYGSGRAYSMLEELVTVAPARLSGSANAARAVEWAKKTLEGAGADSVCLEKVMVPVWRRGKTQSLAIVSPEAAKADPLPIFALGGSIATPPGGITAEVIEVRSFEHLRALGDQAKGKIIFFNQPMDRSLPSTGAAYGGAVRQRGRGAVEAAKMGGVAAIVRSMTTRLDDHPHTGAMGYEDGVVKVPAAAVSTMGAERLAKRLAAGEKVVLHFEIECETLPDAESANVVADYRGTEKPDEIVLVGGHLDSWDVNQGASDDGTGIVQSIEVMRLWKALGIRPKRTLRVVCFMNEENGLAGGRAYYEAHKDEMAKHVVALESDSGGFTPRGFAFDATNADMPDLKAMGSLLEVLGAERITGAGGGADVSPMNAAGVPLASYVPDGHRYFDVHHSALDTIEQINERELEAGAAAMAAMLYMIADREKPLERVKPRENPRNR